MDGTVGYWVGRGTPSVVDWCEPNYVYTPYIAEFWNTLSSGWLALLGVYGLWAWWRSDDPLEKRFGLSFAVLIVVGVGSIAFHATLLRLPQALDELPMVYMGLIAAWMVRFRDRPADEGRVVGGLMFAYAVGFTLAYALFESYFVIFLASYSLLVTYVALRSLWLTWIKAAPSIMSFLLATATLTFLGTFFFCWIPEHLVLGCDHPAQALQLHSIWHFGAGLGTYVWLLWAIVDRARWSGGTVRLSGAFVEVV